MGKSKLQEIQKVFQGINTEKLILTGRTARRLSPKDKKYDRIMKWDGERCTFIQMDECKDKNEVLER